MSSLRSRDNPVLIERFGRLVPAFRAGGLLFQGGVNLNPLNGAAPGFGSDPRLGEFDKALTGFLFFPEEAGALPWASLGVGLVCLRAIQVSFAGISSGLGHYSTKGLTTLTRSPIFGLKWVQPRPLQPKNRVSSILMRD